MVNLLGSPRLSIYFLLLHVFSNAKSRTIGSLGTCSVATTGGDEGPADALPEATAVDGLGVKGETDEELEDWTGGSSGGVLTATPMSWGWGAGVLFRPKWSVSLMFSY
jgi:hypothetical protein